MGPQLPAIYRTKGKDIWKVLTSTYDEQAPLLNVFKKEDLGWIYPAGVVVLLKTADNKYLIGTRGVMNYKKDQGKFSQSQELDLSDWSSKVLSNDTIYTLEKPKNIQLPCGFIDFVDKNDTTNSWQNNLPEYLYQTITKNALNELNEEFLPIPSDQIHSVTIKDFSTREKKIHSNKHKQKEIECIGYFIVEVGVNLTAKQLMDIWSQEKNRGKDWLELPNAQFMTLEELQKLNDDSSFTKIDSQVPRAIEVIKGTPVAPSHNSLLDCLHNIAPVKTTPARTI